MRYKDIVNLRSDNLEKSIIRMSDFLESLPENHKEIVDKELIKHAGIFNNYHFGSKTADYAICNMKPAIGHKSVKDLLIEMSVTPEKAKESIRHAYEKAIQKGIEKGFSAPKLSSDFSEYDYYVVLAMIISDNWISGDGDIDKYSMMAYEFMSDPDADEMKIWNYFFG